MQSLDILLASYNGEKYITEQIDSILSQTYRDFRLIIRDDGSSDSTCSIIEEYKKRDERIIFLNDDLGNLGFVGNFETLLKYSDADLIMLSDQDDFWFPDKIERYRQSANRHDSSIPLLVHSDAVVCNENLSIIKSSYIFGFASENLINNIFFAFIVQGAAMMLNKSLRDLILPFPQGTYLHDRYIHIMTELFGRRVFIPQPTMYYRQHRDNQIGSGMSIIRKILKKRYFDERDRKLMKIIYDIYGSRMSADIRNLFNAYFDITLDEVGRFRRLSLAKKNKIRMHILKKLFLLLKG